MTPTTPPPLHHPLDEQRPEPGQVLAVAPGVGWVRMRLPFALDHINLWLLADVAEDGTPGWAVVDTGIANDETRAAWEQVFATGLQGRPVLRVINTHMHPDHLGLADWLCERWHRPQAECRLWISATDWYVARNARVQPGGFGGERTAAFFARHGVADPAVLESIRHKPNDYAAMVPAVPGRYRRLQDDLRVRMGAHDWFCIAGYGHAPEHMSLHCPALGVLISGDMVLPRISTNVSVIDLEPEADPLGQYLDSLDEITRRVGPDAGDRATLVLPSHGLPFTGLQARVDALHAHHAERLAEVQAACAREPHSAADLMPLLFRRPLDLHQTRFALGEAIAHAHRLWHQGLLTPLEGADGVLRWGPGPAAPGA
ncbi:MBL fold metallo-hydrolase [Ideonella livida]|uniref:MBL fold metallo-hydrolase n=1 Tax=Ideonella livida TaxID=2707176 RepID=A0A7C9PJJ9_9BURK|nr:MBL fold metallo-hydrolase [Ideonella livida]NDY92670.1 MBL fold metallo-hydrolase [Ideonella livida]